MKRRTFTFGLGALCATPALPAVTPAFSATVTEKFATAKLLSRCHDRASPAMLQRLMQVDADTAQGLYSMLQEQNVIAPGLDGIARATNPLNTNCVPNEAIRARDLARSAIKVKGQLRDLVDRRKTLKRSEHRLNADVEPQTPQSPSLAVPSNEEALDFPNQPDSPEAMQRNS